MEKTILGRTGLSVSVMGLGCGGHSRLGLSQGKGDDNAIAIVRRAIELGVNFIDTAEQYRTETVVGQAIAGFVPRGEVVLSTKVSIRGIGDEYRSAEALGFAVEAGLQRLQTDYVDILHLHGIPPADYTYCATELVPELVRLREAGKIRFLAISEQFINDTGHKMFTEGALKDDCWDVIMVGFSLLNQSARERVLPITLAKDVGTLDMFAVRRALGNLDVLRELMAGLVAKGQIDAEAFDAESPLGFLVADGVAEDIPDAAYRFCRDEPGIDVVLSGTGSLDHLEANVESLNRPPLPEAITRRLHDLFAGIDSVSGN
jgi:aryl-alcohol dehydrogenase-like predicted oxidoreductase